MPWDKQFYFIAASMERRLTREHLPPVIVHESRECVEFYSRAAESRTLTGKEVRKLARKGRVTLCIRCGAMS